MPVFASYQNPYSLTEHGMPVWQAQGFSSPDAYIGAYSYDGPGVAGDPWNPVGGTGEPGGGPAQVAAAAAEPTRAQTDAMARVREVLSTFDLGGLADFVWQQILDGRSDAEVYQALRDHPEYKKRFIANERRRANGYAPMSEAEIVTYEVEARSRLKAANLPPGFWDQNEDLITLIANNVSLAQLDARINAGFVRVANAAPEVRAAFGEYFGADGDVALATFFLDHNRAQPLIENAVAAAEIGGVGRRFGFRFSHTRAEQLRGAGIDATRTAAGLASLHQRRALFDETITESDDFDMGIEGIDATFGLSPDAAANLERRAATRAAAFAGGGGAQAGRGGITGLGSAT